MLTAFRHQSVSGHSKPARSGHFRVAPDFMVEDAATTDGVQQDCVAPEVRVQDHWLANYAFPQARRRRTAPGPA